MGNQSEFIFHAISWTFGVAYVILVAAWMGLVPLRFLLRPVHQPEEWQAATSSKSLRGAGGTVVALLPLLLVGFTTAVAWLVSERILIAMSAFGLVSGPLALWACLDFFAIRRTMCRWATQPGWQRIPAARRYELARLRLNDVNRILSGLLAILAGVGLGLALSEGDREELLGVATLTFALLFATFSVFLWLHGRFRPLCTVLNIYDRYQTDLGQMGNADTAQKHRIWWDGATLPRPNPTLQHRLRTLVDFVDLELFRQAAKVTSRFRAAAEAGVEDIVADLADRVRDRRPCEDELTRAIEVCVTGELPFTSAAGTRTRTFSTGLDPRNIRWEWVFKTVLAATVGLAGKWIVGL